jgi:phosphatidylinositol alpha-1,6-mannosyltransferase
MAPRLRARTRARRFVGSSHSHECFWTKAPLTRRAIRSLGEGLDHLTYISEYTRSVIAPVLTPAASDRMVRLSSGVDADQFAPVAGGSKLRAALGLEDRPVILSVARLVPHKGQDTLIRALPQVLSDVPRAVLLVVGGGSNAGRLAALAEDLQVSGAVRLAGPVPHASVAPYYGAADVFALPTRNRTAGLQVEGLGMVCLEAAAAGLPVVVGDSGGAPETVRDGETGFVVDSTAVGAVADRLTELLAAPARAAAMGAAGRDWMIREWTWDQRAAVLRGLLSP